jgi:hypothetical protein
MRIDPEVVVEDVMVVSIEALVCWADQEGGAVSAEGTSF